MAALMTTEINTSEKVVSDIRECKEMDIKIYPPKYHPSTDNLVFLIFPEV